MTREEHLTMIKVLGLFYRPDFEIENRRWPSESFYLLKGIGAVYVKEANFFKDQGGLLGDWGRDWFGPVFASNIEEARKIGERMSDEEISAYLWRRRETFEKPAQDTEQRMALRMEHEGEIRIWTKVEMSLSIRPVFWDDPDRLKEVVVRLDDEDYEHSYSSEEALELAQAIIKAAGEASKCR